MPKSRIRKKKDGSAAKPEKQQTAKLDMSSGFNWVAPLMLVLFGVGLAWIVVFYITEGSLPVSALGNWNIVVGFGFIAGGFVVSTQWK
ncbi:cell division protein CrgA [Streptomyces sp. ST2-7A]|uniref:cell division protein CrgA n=1 Tax=Streptomyces sp. ST2-7A TaxID=2907214 RepID=UPI001F45DF60|nr:cell division protein CrgA [Streptomyces sp. ST2-7A]MCE7080688.1 cell division protein CrgA [Streptomyces sp. ST2-7A]